MNCQILLKLSNTRKNYINITFEKLDNVDLSEFLKVLYKATTYKPTKTSKNVQIISPVEPLSKQKLSELDSIFKLTTLKE